MKEVYATYIGNGKLEARGRLDVSLLDETYAVGSTVKLKTTKPRSMKQLAHYFAWLRQVFDNLPEACPERFRSTEHLRAWFLYKAGYCNVMTVPIAGIGGAHLKLFQKVSRQYLFFEHTETTLYVFEPHSVAVENMGQYEFNDLVKQSKELVHSYLIPGIDMRLLEKSTKDADNG